MFSASKINYVSFARTYQRLECRLHQRKHKDNEGDARVEHFADDPFFKQPMPEIFGVQPEGANFRFIVNSWVLMTIFKTFQLCFRDRLRLRRIAISIPKMFFNGQESTQMLTCM